MFSDSLVFLGGSQTFVGVLATIIVMCVLVGESNFIYKILGLIKQQMTDSLPNVSAQVNYDKLHSDSDYKLLKVLISEKQRLSPEQIAAGGQLLSDISLWKSSVQVDSAKPDMEGVDRELTLASLYSFLFVLIVFLFDELFRTELITFNDILVSVLTLFTLFSSVYWIGKWFAYLLDLLRNNGKRTYNLVSDDGMTKAMHLLHKTHLNNDWLRMTIEVGYFALIVAFMWYLDFSEKVLMAELIGFGILPPMVFEGLFHLYPLKQPESDSDEGYKTTLNHFGRLLVLSVVVSLVFLLLDNYLFACREMLLSYENLRALKIFSVGFVIFNGLVIPSVLPFHVYRYLSKAVLKQPGKMQKKVDKEIEAYLAQVREITHNCTVD